jgi:HSP20 family protein
MAVLARRRGGTPQTGSAQQIRRWEPFSELEELQQQMGRLMESALTGTGAEGLPWTPPVDIEETEDAWVIEAELPGVEREDIHIEALDSDLTISGEITERERTGILRRKTRRVGRFEFRVTLPGAVDADAVDATLHDGVLTVRVPKAEQARKRQIEVKSA